jgi:hypothetical protein
MSEKHPSYDEPLDSPFIDADPDFREALRLLNAAGVHTVSSCQGHAPGTRYPDVQVWMKPYITCELGPGSSKDTIVLLAVCGGVVRSSDGRVRAEFPNGWNWKRSVSALRARLPHVL